VAVFIIKTVTAMIDVFRFFRGI
jgi:hypothetical protein